MNNHSNIIWPKSLTTSLGTKGYTILKQELSVSQQNALKEMLTISPKIIGAPVAVNKTFTVYRESENKLYVPRHFGEKLLGPPKSIKISNGTPINLKFNGELRPYQIPVVEAYLNQVCTDIGGGGLIEMYCGAGKTDTTLKIIEDIGLKTLIICHKEFLVDQWIERINRYYPTARIGKIQGPVVDIEDKDIVICMLQSLSQKDYPDKTFSTFGFTIIDECHHISAEVFSRSLFKVVTKYMLGLSATMERNDGTTPVIKMFLGDTAYKLERSKTDVLTVRGITFQCDDDEYNVLELDFRGKTAASKMLSKISTYNRRSQFILQVIKDMLVENPRQQIILLASYKNILEYMHTAINHHNIATVGYYVGGMKQKALKESENKQIILATYAMAAEGLDIKTLSTLIMLTPMTNIEQAVGRILRQKHDFEPVVVDIIDTHDNFQRQWAKRKRFYKNQNYKIIQTTSSTYSPDPKSWRITWKPVEAINEKVTATNASLINDSDDEDDSDNDREKGVCLLLPKKNLPQKG